mmetsp:Transcript_25993/g.72602  ORF Transcript_25993/g.72602 Transcript_25993/m.72602 type:complete len:80 (-) Transcript_25993:576-815(-)
MEQMQGAATETKNSSAKRLPQRRWRVFKNLPATKQANVCAPSMGGDTAYQRPSENPEAKNTTLVSYSHVMRQRLPKLVW